MRGHQLVALGEGPGQCQRSVAAGVEDEPEGSFAGHDHSAVDVVDDQFEWDDRFGFAAVAPIIDDLGLRYDVGTGRRHRQELDAGRNLGLPVLPVGRDTDRLRLKLGAVEVAIIGQRRNDGQRAAA